MKHYDAIIIGFGKAGKTLAFQLATKQNKKVALIEKDEKMYGGTCINVGCIPTKSLIMQSSKRSYKEAVQQKEVLISKLRENNFNKLNNLDNVTIINGSAKFVDDHHIAIDGKETIEADTIFINTGSTTIIPSIEGIDLPLVYTSTSLMDLDVLPKRLAIIGGGYIGLEFASMYSQYGSEVSVFEANDRLLAKDDDDISLEIINTLKEDGVSFHTSAKVQKFTQDKDEISVVFAKEDKVHTEVFDAVLVAIGRKANTENLGLENTSIQVDERGTILVDKYLKTSAPHVFALGDVKGGLQFTYISLDDSRIVYDYLYGEQLRTTANRGHIAFSVFMNPTYSRVGLTQKEALAQGYEIKVATMPAAAIPRANINENKRGILKVIVDAKTDAILGAALVMQNSEEIINFIQLAMNQNLPYQVIKNHIFTHPSLSESLNDLFSLI